MRLIDADALKEEIENLIGYSLSYEALLNAIENAPTVAVNCKECDGYEAGYNAGYVDGIRGADWSGD